MAVPCGPRSCGCALRSETLSISGNGSAANPYDIEVLAAANAGRFFNFATTAERDSVLPSPSEGDVAYVRADDRVYLFTTAWQIWSEQITAWTSTNVLQSVTVTHTVTEGWYQRHRGKFWARARFDITGAGTATAGIAVQFPFAIANTAAVGGIYRLIDSSAALAYDGVIRPNSTTSFTLAAASGGGSSTVMGSTTFTAGLASGDSIDVTLTGRY